jgi:hypothetical protein
MRRYMLVLAAALFAMAFMSSSASAVSNWGGWQNEHPDNLAGPSYYSTAEFGNNGAGTSDYCVAPFAAPDGDGDLGPSDDDCSGPGVTLPIVFSGALFAANDLGCNGQHEDAGKDGSGNLIHVPLIGDGPGNPCASNDNGGAGDDMIGAFYVGFSQANGGGGIIGLQG